MRGSRQVILNHLERYGGLTSAEAFNDYGVTRLAAVIHDLRNMGYDIVTQDCMGKTRFGETCKYARYVCGPNYKKENS